MAKAIWNDTIVAESDETILVDGNHYFPPDAVSRPFAAWSRLNDRRGRAGT